jgi:tight adherence protein B
MMARSLRAGHALTSAFELVAGEMPEPISVEFARAFEEQRLGMPLERAVREMAARAPSNGDLKIFAVSAVVQKETGGNLAEILEGIAHTIRERYRFFGKLRALTAEARASAWVVSLLPLAIFAFLASSQPEYLRPLLEKPLGRNILLGGAAAWVLGVLWFQKLTRFRY